MPEQSYDVPGIHIPNDHFAPPPGFTYALCGIKLLETSTQWREEGQIDEVTCEVCRMVASKVSVRLRNQSDGGASAHGLGLFGAKPNGREAAMTSTGANVDRLIADYWADTAGELIPLSDRARAWEAKKSKPPRTHSQLVVDSAALETRVMALPSETWQTVEEVLLTDPRTRGLIVGDMTQGLAAWSPLVAVRAPSGVPQPQCTTCHGQGEPAAGGETLDEGMEGS